MGFGRKLLRALCYRAYPTARWYESRYAHRLPTRKTPVLVYQMGKVGSISVQRSLAAAGGIEPFHLHFLSREGLASREPAVARRFASEHRMVRVMQTSLYLRRLLDSRRIDRRWKVVTLMRDPVARLYSGFFETDGASLPRDEFQDLLQTRTPEQIADELAPSFHRWVDGCMRGEGWQMLPDAWFESELKRVFDLDVLAEPFDAARGYHIYSTGKLPVLLIKLERLDDCASEAFREFLGLEQLTLIRGNESSAKDCAAVYDVFRKRHRLPEREIDRIYASPYVRHFYSEAEVDAFRRRWSATPAAATSAR